MKRILTTTAMLFALAAPAAAGEGEIVIIGQGLASAEPEYVSLQVEVTSICYDTSREAKNANAQLANQIVTVLRNFTQDSRDKVIATGDVNVLRTETIYNGSDPKILCEMKWRATNTITLQTSALDSGADIQDRVLTAVDQLTVDTGKVEQTYAELGRPVFKLYPETIQKLKTEAHVAAYDDAKLQFDAFQSRCNFQDTKLKKITPPEYEVYARRDGVVVSANADSTPIIPDDISVNARWRFEWTFTPAAGCPL